MTINLLSLKGPQAETRVVGGWGVEAWPSLQACGEPGISILVVIQKETKLGLGGKGRYIEVGSS